MSQLLQNAVCGGLMILAVAALRRVLKDRLVPGARLALWAACLFRLLTPAAPESVLSLWGLGKWMRTAAPPAAPAPNAGGTFAPAAPGAAPAAPVPAAAEPGIPWEMVLLGIWVAVGLVVAARYVRSYIRIRRAVSSAVPVGRDDPRYAPLPGCARLREGPVDGAPLTFGAVRPTVVLSPGLSGEVLECVLVHEGVHAGRRDNLWHYAMAAALTVFWWNPAVWLMARLLRRDMELSCDRAALKKLGADRRADYANALVSMASQGAGPAFCQTFGRKAAEERIVSIMKYKKTTMIGAALTLALVLAVTAGFASNPGEPAPDEDSTTSSAPAPLMYALSTGPNGGVKKFRIALAYLEEALAEHTADGSMTREEADRILAQAREASADGVTLEWAFEGDSGLFSKTAEQPGFNVYYIDESGREIAVDPATVVGAFVFAPDNSPADVTAPSQKAAAGAVEYDGRTYNRADLSAETLEWLDWYLALPEAEQLAVSYEPPELWDGKAPDVADAGQPASGAEGICGLPTAPTTDCGLDSCTETRLHQHADGHCFLLGPVCPVEGCTITGCHVHNGEAYSCNGAGHSGGVCDGSCLVYFAPDYDPGVQDSAASVSQPVSAGHHSDSHHGNGHHN